MVRDASQWSRAVQTTRKAPRFEPVVTLWQAHRMRRGLLLFLGVLPIVLLVACGTRSERAVADPRVGKVF
jgi:hypothetical protein